ncbi:sensor histidine kinase [Sulfurospirillum multivorans]|uniref:histidine kinase n=2 Tax=Sulfurospirillum multivorans TaxID=66821 RepID=A0AA86AJ41_SULMK|nr:HAMP domain-containing sensor histidine kinase [Sulfurospirillum multivorans]AHJ11616.1 putative two-component histidine kinase [Sulfurospirillum multivorans DSM 12446]QEH05116.1 putative two-component histidine kinase [Sulfurospirillum multivorans]
MKSETKNAFIFAIILTFLTLLLVSFPILNYLSVSLRLSQVNQETQLRSYAKEIEATIQGILPLQKTFLFPRSILFKSALLDANNRIVFSLIEEPIPSFSDEFVTNENSLFYKHPLAANALHVKYLIVQKEISHSQVIFDILVIIGVVLMGMLLFSYLLLKLLLKPYIETSTRMNLFFTDVMHELKTPLGIMQLNIEGLVLKYKDKRLGRTLAALSTLATLYDDLEYLIKNKTITYTTELLNFSTFLEDRIAYFEALSASKEITICSHIEPQLYVRINRIELQRIIDNNLTNAIKYSPTQTIIEVALNSDNDRLCFKVKDQGVGIKEVEKIFERHYRGDIYKGGFGIGLSIVKSICDKYGVVIEVQSEEKKGSEFSYWFRKEEKEEKISS